LWGKDEEDKSSNYRELRNLVETVEEEAREGYLKDTELWLFLQGGLHLQVATRTDSETEEGRNTTRFHTAHGPRRRDSDDRARH